MSAIARPALTVGTLSRGRMSLGSSVVERWVVMPGRRTCFAVVTSGVWGQRLSPHSAAAESWLSSAPSPHARTAAIARATGSTRR